MTAGGPSPSPYFNIQVRVARTFASERLVLIAVVALWCALAGALPAAAVVCVVIALLALTQAVTWRRFRRGASGAVTTNL